MAKVQKNRQISAAFWYLEKAIEDQEQPEGFSEAEFERVVNRISNVAPLDLGNDEVVTAIKSGQTLPFLFHEEVEPGLHFGDFEGAYYGQRFRNNRLGEIGADDINLRIFHYLITRLRDGKILVGVTYHGLFGAYSDLRSVLTRLLFGDHQVVSKALKNLNAEIGDGHPMELKLVFRKQAPRIERRPIFGTTGAIAIKSGDFGEDFGDRVREAANRIRGDDRQRRAAIAEIVNEAEMLEIDEDDIVGCSAVVRRNGRRTTVYFLGENRFSTKHPLGVEVNREGLADRNHVQARMIQIMREEILPMLA